MWRADRLHMHSTTRMEIDLRSLKDEGTNADSSPECQMLGNSQFGDTRSIIENRWWQARQRQVY